MLEIGCGDGGVLLPFWKRGCYCVGIDMSESKIRNAREILSEQLEVGRMVLLTDDIYDVAVDEVFPEKFDLILLKDTIEHVYNQEKLLARLTDYLAPGGRLFLAFPPWRMPFGGHQQITTSRFGKLPYYHILPRPIYKGMLKIFGEPEARIESLMEIVDTRLSISSFEKKLRGAGWAVEKRELFLLNPIYEFKFGVKPVKQLPVVRSIPFLRDFVTTACYYLARLP